MMEAAEQDHLMGQNILQPARRPLLSVRVRRGHRLQDGAVIEEIGRAHV